MIFRPRLRQNCSSGFHSLTSARQLTPSMMIYFLILQCVPFVVHVTGELFNGIFTTAINMWWSTAYYQEYYRSLQVYLGDCFLDHSRSFCSLIILCLFQQESQYCLQVARFAMPRVIGLSPPHRRWIILYLIFRFDYLQKLTLPY